MWCLCVCVRWWGVCGVCVCVYGGEGRGGACVGLEHQNTPVSGSGCGEEEERQEEAGDDED